MQASLALQISRRLFDNRNDLTTHGDSWMTDPQFRVQITKNPLDGAEGLGGYYMNGEFVVSYVKMDVDIAATN